MQMSKYFICCEQCFETICRKNTRAGKVWMDICAMHMSIGEIFLIENTESQELKYLENLGFLISTDTNNGILLRIKGHIFTDDGQDFFCLKGGNHV